MFLSMGWDCLGLIFSAIKRDMQKLFLIEFLMWLPDIHWPEMMNCRWYFFYCKHYKTMGAGIASVPFQRISGDGWMRRWMDGGWMRWSMDEMVDGLLMDEMMDGMVDEMVDGWGGGCMDGWRDGWDDWWDGGWMGWWVYRWMERWMDVDGWWMGGWLDI